MLRRTKSVGRRQALREMGVAAGALVIGGCGSDSPTGASSTATTAASATTANATTTGSCAVTPTETIGPYPSVSDIFRSDVTEGKPGVPLTLAITVVNAANACSPLAGASVEIWQCDADGHYSQYAQQGYDGVGESFLRGIQTTSSGGLVRFATVYPGWYPGRATHVHVEVTQAGRSLKVTQIAFPENVSAAVYASGVYAAKGLNPTSNRSDNVFADSEQAELATLVGSPAAGYTASITIGISA